ncbi:thioredoxin family protein [Sulfurimonas sp. C5]|uniref:thioredoxin family protein n=1 Tax=Sulfurimonas sp. C5 TaxID=3036947 RepID=UPI002455566D|nr:thioredoxin family protein [Sulfurimonas sp. C5]MDH4943858.1 thioredoxin family protein [Sulfurimonas sp. C5]
MKKLFLMLSLAVTLTASTMYTLSGVQKVYPIVEVSGQEIPKEFKDTAKEEMLTVIDELGIAHKGYDQRALALLVNSTHIENTLFITMKLVIGEQVLRIDSKEKTFAMTYESVEKIQVQNIDDVADKLEDGLMVLLDRFSEQYTEENKKIVKVNLENDDFFTLGYETNYDQAVKKAQKFKKPILLVLVANYCPWCRKFEENVLRKKDVHEMIMKNYIPVIINKEKGGFPKEFDISFTPITHFIDYKTLKSVKMIAGYNNKDEFLYTLRNFTSK